jgi:hypothetical protein
MSDDNKLVEFSDIEGNVMKEGTYQLKVNEETLGKSAENLRKKIRDITGMRIPKGEVNKKMLNRIAKFSSPEDRKKIGNLPEYQIYKSDLDAFTTGKVVQTNPEETL